MPHSATILRHAAMYRYGMAVGFALAAQLASIPFDTTSVSFIVYAPFVVVSALLGGFGPGLLTTTLCVLEALYYVVEPSGFFVVARGADWDSLAALFSTGFLASLLSERLKQSSRRLSVEQHRTASILNSITDGFSAFDHKWRYTYINSAGAKMLGKTPQELLGRTVWELWPHADDSPFGASYRRAVADNIPVQVEAFYPEPLNAWFEVRCYPSPEGLSLFFTDTTGRKQAEEISRLHSSIVESSDDAIISKNLEGAVLSWNRGAETIYGYSAAEMVGRSIMLLIPPGHPDELGRLMQYLKQGLQVEHFETERVHKDGRRIQVALTLSPIKDTHGSVVAVSAIARDITERKRAQKALALSEQRYRSLALVTSQIVWITDPHGEVVDDIPMWREFTGQSPQESTGWGWINALHPQDRERTHDIWARSVKNRSFYSTEYRLRRCDGEYRYMAVHGVPVFEDEGSIREWVSACTDITERVRAEEEVRTLNEKLEKRVIERTAALQTANKELEAFAYSVSHDLRAPLRAVDGFSRILLDEFADHLPAEAQNYLQFTHKNAVQMGNLIDDLLDFSRLSRQPVHKQTVAPAELVRQALEALRPEQNGRRFEIILGNLPACEADPSLLKQVFINLLSNAFKYTRTREVARIEVASSASCIYHVRDNGVGFDMRYRDKLFGVFQRLHNAEVYEGTGVGLAIVHRIVHRHGGCVWADAAPNRGATFYFTLAEAEGCPHNCPVIPAVPGGKETRL